MYTIFIYIVIIIVSYLIFDFIYKNVIIKKNGIPPGPLSLPILGNLHQITRLPHRGLTNLSKKYSDGIYSIYFGDLFTVVVTDLDLIKQIWVTDFFKFSSRPKFDGYRLFSNNFQNLGLSDYETWSKVHSIVVSALTKTKIISKSALTIQEQTKSILNYINSKCENSDKNQFNFNTNEQLIKTFSMNILMELLFSKKLKNKNEIDNEDCDEDDAAKFVKSVNIAFDHLGKGNPSDIISLLKPFYYFYDYYFKKEYKYIMDILENIYNEHLTNLDDKNPKDLFDQLIIETYGDKEFIKNISLDLILAGSDTTISTMEWFILYMINNPDIQENVYNELVDTFGSDNKYVDYSDSLKAPLFNACVKETMRMKPAVPLGVFRYSREDAYVGENNKYFIPKNTLIFQNIYGLNNSEHFVESPEIFKPERWMTNKEYNDKAQNQTTDNNLKSKNYNNVERLSRIIFSSGPRNCAGEKIARVEINILLCNLLLNYKLENGDGDNKQLDETELFFITIRPKPFNIKFTKRN